MNFWHQVAVAGEMGSAYPWVLVGEIVLALVLAAAVPAARLRLRVAVLLLLASLLGTLTGASLLHYDPDGASTVGLQLVHFLAELLYAVGTVQIGGTLLFRAVLPRVGLALAPILLDVVFGLAYAAVTLVLLGRHGVNLSGLIATSAVLTAVIGFSLQDTIGNVMGGVALQAERSVAVGDWVRIGEIEGMVRETRWRQTSIETRDWDTVVIPNSVLMKSAVTVLGRRAGQPRLHRVLIGFNVDFRRSVDDVIGAVHGALRGIAIADVAAEPPPVCVLNEFRDSFGSYNLYYWTADIARIPLTSSEVRRRVLVALQREGLGLSVPSHRVQISMGGGGEDRRHREELDRRVAALEAAEVLAPLDERERRELAARLTAAPFRRGEVINRQGEEADYLYVLTKGEAAVRVSNADGASSPVAVLRAGEVFGEMGMMTGQPRAATVEALTDVLCYRLDKVVFADTLRRRPEIAEAISLLLARRKVELDGVVGGLDADSLRAEVGRAQGDMLRRIREFFLLM